jgi:hypothetical protein
LAGLPKAEEVFGFLFGDLIMTFKKCLRTKNKEKAQATLEYFILFTIVVLMTLLSLSTFRQKFISSAQGHFFKEAVGKQGLDVENLQDAQHKWGHN